MSMHPQRKRRLNVILLILIILAASITLIMYALRQNISLFYSPSQIADHDVPSSRLIRLGGLVVKGSVKREPANLSVNFQVTDNQNSININYNGVLPDLFREGQSIVTQGYLLDKKNFRAIEVLAKHDEKYMPPEVKSTIRVRKS